MAETKTLSKVTRDLITNLHKAGEGSVEIGKQFSEDRSTAGATVGKWKRLKMAFSFPWGSENISPPEASLMMAELRNQPRTTREEQVNDWKDDCRIIRFRI